MRTLVLDTSVFVSALLGPGGASREVLRRCLNAEYLPLMGAALYAEHEAVLSRERKFARCALPSKERADLLDAYLRVCRWTKVYFLWRPNLPDESDDHLVELAMAGGAEVIVTKNVRDFRAGELKFPGLRILEPKQLLKE